MSTIAITSLPIVTTSAVGDVFPLVQNGATSQITNADLFNSVNEINGVALGIGPSTSVTNTTIGNDSFLVNTTGNGNVAVGADSLKANTTGISNVAVGFGAMIANVAGSNNVAMGLLALGAATGSFNTAIGRNAGGDISSGAKNTIIGNYSGNGGGLDIRTASNYIVLSDGDGNPRAYWNGADAAFGGLIGTSAAAATIASATTIAPTKSITFISGTAAVVTITAPTSFAAAGGSITLIPTAAFTWTTAGNIAVAGTAVVSRALTMTYDSGTTKWYPSYV